MAIVVTPIINGQSSRTTQAGRTDTIPIYIEGLTLGTADATAAGVMEEANAALAGAGFFYSAIHPYNGSLVCNEIKIDPFLDSRTQVKALATYVQASLFVAGSTVVRFRAWTERILTSRYADKSLILVNYTGPDGTVFPPQLARVPGTKAVGKLIVEREVSFDPTGLLVCENKLNAGGFRGQEEGSFLCTAINIDPTGDGRWRVVGEFDYDEFLHVVPAFYTNPVTGEPYPDVIGSSTAAGTYDPDIPEGNGFVNNTLQDLIDFGSFGF
jgi:hypothetical protein